MSDRNRRVPPKTFDTGLDKPDPGPLPSTLTMLSLVEGRVRSGEGDIKVSLANLPNSGNAITLRILADLVANHSSDCLMTAEFENRTIRSFTQLPVERAFDLSRPYARLRVRMKSGHASETVEVANIPATHDGILLVRQLIEKSPNSVFFTTDFGQLRIGDIDPKSLTDLNETAPT